MIFGEPILFADAVKSRAWKTLLPTELSSEELEALSVELLEMASFSAGVTDAYVLQRFDDLTVAIAGGPTPADFARRASGEAPLLTDPASARLEMKNFLRSIGYRPKAGDEGTIKDLSTDARLNLKLRTDVEMAQGYGYHKASQKPVTLSLIPCQELVRISRRKAPRDWPERWHQGGGKFYAGRMIAAKDDPVWTNISRFGLPYPPYDFHSGMGVRGVRRPEAEALGVIAPDQQITPQPRALKDDLQAGGKAFSTALQEALKANGYRIRDGILTANSGDEDLELHRAIVAAYDAHDEATWDVGDDEREALAPPDLAHLAFCRYFAALLRLPQGDPLRSTANAAKSSGPQFRCPKGTAKGGRFAKSLSACGGPSKASAHAPLGPTHAAARKAFLADHQAIAHLTGDAYTQALRGRLKVKRPVDSAYHVTEVLGATPAERALIYQHTQELLDLLPPGTARKLGTFRVRVSDHPGNGERGKWKQGTRTIVLNRGEGGVNQGTIYHEMGHWMHDNAPVSIRTAVRDHYAQRTAGEPMQHVSGGVPFDFKRDQFFDDYTGREYGGSRQGEGTEIVSRHMEHLHDGTNHGFGVQKAERLSDLMGRASYRETASVALSVFYYGRRKKP